MKRRIPLSLLLVLSSSMANASAIMNIQGKIFSVTSDEFIILSGLDLIHIRKDSLSMAQRKTLETASTRQVSLELPIESVINVRPGPQRKIKPEGS